jgi:hypothetical protein
MTRDGVPRATRPIGAGIVGFVPDVNPTEARLR